MNNDFKPFNRSASASGSAPNAPAASTGTSAESTPPQPLPPHKRILKYFHKPRNKKEWIILAAIVLLFSGGVGTAVFALTRDKPAPPPVVEQKAPEPPKPTTEPSRLTGVPVKLELNKRPVTGVMIENSPDARPQAGLHDAGVVFEAVAEAGITRFLALYQEAKPGHIGPVRSVRPYFLDWVTPFDAGLAHVGGSPEALAQLRGEQLKDLDQFTNPEAFNRVSNRFAPHNMYTDMARLDALNKKRGYTASKFTSFPRKAEKPAAQPGVTAIDLNISSFLYNVHYDYDKTANRYKRVMGGRPHVDEKSAKQITPKVVMALVLPKGIHPNGVHTVYGTTGSGKLFIFQDGVKKEGTWHKANRKSQFVFKDADGQPLKLNPGQTWITIVDTPAAVVAKP
jgi:hypothetical protein